MSVTFIHQTTYQGLGTGTHVYDLEDRVLLQGAYYKVVAKYWFSDTALYCYVLPA